MTYSSVYCALINKRLQNPLPKCEYGEVHHIIPKSEGGENDKSNLVRLSAREHYVAHLLLAKIYDDYKMYSAISYMRTGTHDGRDFRINSRLYKKLREEFGRKSSSYQKGKPKLGFKGHHHTNEAKEKNRIAHLRENLSQETRRRISEALKGKKLSEEHRRKISERTKGHNNPMFGKDWRVGKTQEELEIIRQKQSLAKKGRPNLWQRGRKASAETRRKMSEAHKKNPQLWMKTRDLGTHWYNNGLKNIRAKECPDGFVLGRLSKKRN